METIKVTTIRGKRFVNAYKTSNMHSLNDAYAHASWAKQSAERDCREWCRNENGYGFKIIAAGTFSFTAAWMTEDGLRVETKSGSYIVK